MIFFKAFFLIERNKRGEVSKCIIILQITAHAIEYKNNKKGFHSLSRSPNDYVLLRERFFKDNLRCNFLILRLYRMRKEQNIKISDMIWFQKYADDTEQSSGAKPDLLQKQHKSYQNAVYKLKERESFLKLVQILFFFLNQKMNLWTSKDVTSSTTKVPSNTWVSNLILLCSYMVK